ncbi:MAG: di-trans,poly-cis-decaprenylcistransferase [Candidatus Obscuribacter phosphatis]|uniref:Isoprenyl transferase n=1 Tax=Candidatus Obscuribacter phosphatis TaxID=1906157 RepID=A0A8J7PME7_9BACT|nr:di-trans,poly-cis-decaprenylcistransferase [Candidatus Obscuribacter phosphatis]
MSKFHLGKLEKPGTSRAAEKSEPLPLKHVAVIMDGNRRWAENHRMPKLKGHQEGVKSLKRLVRHVGALKLEYLTVYAFSSENWQRSSEEVKYLFELFSQVLESEFVELSQNNVRLSFIGHMEGVPKSLRRSMEETTKQSEANTGLNLQVAINYGSRLEITEAVKKIALDVKEGRLAADDITEDLIGKSLYTSRLPDPELLIRTGGEMRLSNYLLWQSAYTEIFITQTLWPDFTPECFDQAIDEFKRRHRRWGGD